MKCDALKECLGSAAVKAGLVGLVFYCVGWSSVALALKPPRVSVSCERLEESRRIDIKLPTEADASAKIEGRRLFIRFSVPVQVSAQDGQQRCTAVGFGLIESFKALTVVLPEGFVFEVRKASGLIQASSRPQIVTKDQDELELGLARAEVLYQTSGAAAVFPIMDPLLDQYPEDPQVLYAFGSYEAAAGKRVSAARTLNRWVELEGTAGASDPLWLDLTTPYRPTLSGSFEFIDAGSQQRERRSRAFASGGWGDSFPRSTLAADVRIDNADIQNIRGPSGEVVDRNVQLENYRLLSRHPLESGLVELGLAASDYSFGGHLGYLSEDLRGQTEGLVMLNEPTWEYASSVAFEGTKSTVGLQRKYTLGPKLRALTGVAGNSFSLQSKSDAASSISVNGSLAYTLLSDKMTVDIVYLLDADYFSHLRRVTGEDGSSHRAFAVQSSEFHSLSLAAAQQVIPQSARFRRMQIFGVAGYAFDRLGEPAPQLGLVFEGGWWHGPSVRAEVNRSYVNTGISDTQTRYYFELAWQL